MIINEDLQIGNNGNTLKTVDTFVDSIEYYTLWTNPNPGASFSSQEITIDTTYGALDKFDNYDLEFYLNTNCTEYTSYHCHRMWNTNYVVQFTSTAGQNMFCRFFQFKNTGSLNKIWFGDGMQPGVNVYNNHVIPYRIIGHRSKSEQKKK